MVGPTVGLMASHWVDHWAAQTVAQWAKRPLPSYDLDTLKAQLKMCQLLLIFQSYTFWIKPSRRPGLSKFEEISPPPYCKLTMLE